jgi:hypothetical protein
MELKMGFFSLFKPSKPSINETLRSICSVYHENYKTTGDSKLAFVEMAKEVHNQVEDCPGFVTHIDTYRMLGGSPMGANFEKLTSEHSENEELIRSYLLIMVHTYIRKDYYHPEDFEKQERLKIMIKSSLALR